MTFTGILLFYLDINECAKKIDRCQQNCTNFPGFYVCSCKEGFTKNIRNLRKCDGLYNNNNYVYYMV